MLVTAVTRLVEFCSRYAWAVIVLAAVIAGGSGVYATQHFAITTDINNLLAPNLEWRKRERAYDAAFPGSVNSILIVVDAPTPELATEASSLLAGRLEKQPALFKSVKPLDRDPFFTKNGLLFQSEAELADTTRGLASAGPIIGALASDPSLRGLTRGLSFGLLGVQSGGQKLDEVVRPLSMSADTIDKVLAGEPASFSWHQLLSGKAPQPKDLRRMIEVLPVLDYAALEPGEAASEAIRKTAADLRLAEDFRARVRLTGPVAMADEEFGTIKEGALVNSVATILVVLVILWLALRSGRIIVAVFLNLFVGLVVTAALGLIVVGALNLISIAFAVLFVGLGVDFGIQFAVRYRSERHENADLRGALSSTARKIGAPLTLAAAAVAAGFLSFVPTDYRGVSELGQVAGLGMLIAYFTSLTVLPALLTIFKPPGEPEEVGYRIFAPVDRFLERHRIAVVGGTALVAIAGLPLLAHLHFDFNPVNLRSTKVESVATFLDLRNDPTVAVNAINVLVPNLKDAEATAERLKKIPEVDQVMTVASLIPADQDSKLAMIRGLARQLQQPLSAEDGAHAPSDAQNVAALQGTADMLTRLAASASGSGANAANRLAASLTKLAQADKAKRDAVETAFILPLRVALGELRDYLQAAPVSVSNLPESVLRQWVSADGRMRVQAIPKGDPNDNDTMQHFGRAVQAQFPEAVGTPISLLESGRTIVNAFIMAGGFALVSIAILLWIVLKRFGDVLLTLIPLLVAGVITLEACVLIGMPLNYANIIALPLLLGVGVAFKIYYIMAWRAGQTDLLQSSLTRAVIWSALTTATAFGSLWLSSHPGTSSMGKLLALSLVTTMFAAVLFQPALMGKPRTVAAPEPVKEPEQVKASEPAQV
ncbi:MMPL family transporter [Rhodoplanes sp. Z2-YC6860]|uniref:hopanoid transporter HpnN n=1 Tax=Rhodoplanes sp. Z2-YC6860 TaxID=674703 RepID=UPI00078B9ACF|nr:MMPL family transporter [Rhodoplanes sp. Z2-YC6860]AMN43596.1 hopanoid biosynthesis associated RND transporter like protein HpnN [Rhodoplanes sp. Z2-YC6860]